MPINIAAWLFKTGQALETNSTLYRSPKDDEIVIRNRAVAINPFDWILQDFAAGSPGFAKLPYILGNDVAGEVEEVGGNITRFKKGDRVVGHAVGLDPKIADMVQGGFQLYTVLLDGMTSPIPDTTSSETASVLPLGLSTAACGLFEKDQLALPYPSLRPESTGKTLLVWGGSTSVGCNAIQLANTAGYDVFATSSPKNFTLLKSLGASLVFDYNDRSVVDNIVQAMKGRIIAGAINLGREGSAFRCIDVLSHCEGDKVLSLAAFPGPASPPERFVALRMIYYVVTGMIKISIKAWFRGVRTATIFGTSLVHSGVGEAVYVDYLPKALAQGSFVAAPDPVVFGEGLEALQGAMAAQKKGVSAKKIVVVLK